MQHSLHLDIFSSSKESFPSALVLHLLPISLSLLMGLELLSCTCGASAAGSLSPFGLSLRSFPFWQVHYDVWDLSVFLSPSDLSKSPLLPSLWRFLVALPSSYTLSRDQLPLQPLKSSTASFQPGKACGDPVADNVRGSPGN